MNEQEIESRIDARVTQAKTKDYGIWTAGITDNPARRKKEHADSGEDTRYWTSWEADSEEVARSVEDYCKEKGMKGGLGGDTNGGFVYIF